MSSYSRAGGFLKVTLLLLLIVVLLFGGLLWLDFLNLIEAKDYLSPVTRLFGVTPRTAFEDLDDPALLDRERLMKQVEALSLRQDELDRQQDSLDLRESELGQMAEDLVEREAALTDKEKSLNDALKAYDNRKANIEQNARYLAGMPPAEAVAIMLEMSDLDVVDLLRTSERLSREAGEASLVAFWLSLMPPERSAVIQRKMAQISSTGGS